MQLNFSKMHGAGNDFMVIDATQTPVSLSSMQIKQLADRHVGIGFDQLLLVEKPTQSDVDFRYRIFNADGGEVQQCGNGARCFVKFVVEKGLSTKHEIAVETASGVIYPKLENSGLVTVNMGAPKFKPQEIPFIAEHEQKTYALETNNHEPSGDALMIAVVSMGNPHAVAIVDDVANYDVPNIGAHVESHPSFPQRVNAGFMQVLSAHEIKLRVFERGSGETLSCGTGACAAAVSGIRSGLLQSPVLVHTRGGDLNIAWAGNETPVMMTGPAAFVFDGQIEITV